MVFLRKIVLARKSPEVSVSKPESEEKANGKQKTAEAKIGKREERGGNQQGSGNTKPATIVPGSPQGKDHEGQPADNSVDTAKPGQGDRILDGRGSRNDQPGEQHGEQHADACSKCGCPFKWQDTYRGTSGPWRCLICDPPASEMLVARYRDFRISPEEIAFRGRWETYMLVDGDRVLDITRIRGHLQHKCPRNFPLDKWVATLRTKLLCEFGDGSILR